MLFINSVDSLRDMSTNVHMRVSCLCIQTLKGMSSLRLHRGVRRTGEYKGVHFPKILLCNQQNNCYAVNDTTNAIRHAVIIVVQNCFQGRYTPGQNGELWTFTTVRCIFKNHKTRKKHGVFLKGVGYTVGNPC